MNEEKCNFGENLVEDSVNPPDRDWETSGQL